MPLRSLLVSGRLWLALLLLAAAILGGRKLFKKPEEPKKLNPVQEAERHTRNRAAVVAFATALGEILEWRASQPPPTDGKSRAALVRELDKRFGALPSEDLPAVLAEPWKEAKSYWTLLATSGDELDAASAQKGAAAMQRFNQALAEQGFPHLRL